MSELRILICYDGSDGARGAISVAGRLFPAALTTIAHVWWRPIPLASAEGGREIVLPREVKNDIVRQLTVQAEAICAEGVGLAAKAGLDARPDVREARRATWRDLLAAADDAAADVIVIGSRGWGEVRAFLLGSTSAAIAHHAHRPVLIVPPPER